jgi:hypothetical protein
MITPLTRTKGPSPRRMLTRPVRISNTSSMPGLRTLEKNSIIGMPRMIACSGVIIT